MEVWQLIFIVVASVWGYSIYRRKDHEVGDSESFFFTVVLAISITIIIRCIVIHTSFGDFLITDVSAFLTSTIF